METKEISIHEARFFLAVKAAEEWSTNVELAGAASISPRTARAYCKRLADLGVLEMRPLYPGYRYRLAEGGGKEVAAYRKRMEEAIESFGLEK